MNNFEIHSNQHYNSNLPKYYLRCSKSVQLFYNRIFCFLRKVNKTLKDFITPLLIYSCVTHKDRMLFKQNNKDSEQSNQSLRVLHLYYGLL